MRHTALEITRNIPCYPFLCLPNTHLIRSNILPATIATTGDSVLFIIILIIAAKALPFPFSSEIFQSQTAARILTIPGTMIPPVYLKGKRPISIFVIETPKICTSAGCFVSWKCVSIAPRRRPAMHPYAHFSAADVASAAVTITSFTVFVITGVVAAKALTLCKCDSKIVRLCIATCG